MLVSAGPDSIRFWDVRTGRETNRLNPTTGWLSGMALSPDGRRLANGASDGRISIWDVASRQEVATLRGESESYRTEREDVADALNKFMNEMLQLVNEVAQKFRTPSQRAKSPFEREQQSAAHRPLVP